MVNFKMISFRKAIQLIIITNFCSSDTCIHILHYTESVSHAQLSTHIGYADIYTDNCWWI